MLSRSMTTGTTAATRRSTAAAVHAVQPRFEAPARINKSILNFAACAAAAEAGDRVHCAHDALRHR